VRLVRFFNIEYFSFASLISRKDGSFLFFMAIENVDKITLHSSLDHLVLLAVRLLIPEEDIEI